MNIISFTATRIKKITTRKNFLNWTLVGLLVLVVIGGYFLGKKMPQFNLAQLVPIKEKQEITKAPEGILEEEGIEIIPRQSKIYEEEAQPGEGITHLARKALKEYLKEKGQGLSLTKEHKIYIEDYLQKKTGDFWLQVGQRLTFSEEMIKEAINQSLQLTPEQLQNLTQYTALVSGLE